MGGGEDEKGIGGSIVYTCEQKKEGGGRKGRKRLKVRSNRR